MALEKTINGKKYQFHFGMKLIFFLSDVWNLDSYVDVIARIQNDVLLGMGEKISIQSLKYLCDMLTYHTNNEDEANAVLDYMLQDQEFFKLYLESFMKTLPKPKTNNEVIPEKTTASKKKVIRK